MPLTRSKQFVGPSDSPRAVIVTETKTWFQHFRLIKAMFCSGCKVLQHFRLIKAMICSGCRVLQHFRLIKAMICSGCRVLQHFRLIKAMFCSGCKVLQHFRLIKAMICSGCKVLATTTLQRGAGSHPSGFSTLFIKRQLHRDRAVPCL